MLWRSVQSSRIVLLRHPLKSHMVLILAVILYGATRKKRSTGTFTLAQVEWLHQDSRLQMLCYCCIINRTLHDHIGFVHYVQSRYIRGQYPNPS